MPAASDYTSSEFVKFLFIGNSGAGKTGALTSLVRAGYRIRIADFDIGLDALIHHVKEDPKASLDKVDFMSFRDNYKMGPTGPIVKGSPKAFVKGINALDKWEDDTSPAEWGKDTILIIDSLTSMGHAAYAWAKHMQPAVREPRQWYKTAQDTIEDVIATLTSPDFKTNVIVISHVEIREEKDGTVKGFASSIGSALGPKLPRYFNTLVLSETSGTGTNVKRKIKTLPTSLLDLKNPAPSKISAEYPIETGLAEIFEKLKT